MFLIRKLENIVMLLEENVDNLFDWFSTTS